MPSKKPWRIERSRVVKHDRWIHLRADECRTDEGVGVSPYYVLEYPDWVNMVALNSRGEILITELYRHGAARYGLEIPCGTVEKGESALAAAKRELLEETGYTGTFTKISKLSPNPATHTNTVHTFLVKNLKLLQNPRNDTTERITFRFVPRKKVEQWLEQGKFSQALHVAALLLALRRVDKRS